MHVTSTVGRRGKDIEALVDINGCKISSLSIKYFGEKYKSKST